MKRNTVFISDKFRYDADGGLGQTLDISHIHSLVATRMTRFDLFIKQLQIDPWVSIERQLGITRALEIFLSFGELFFEKPWHHVVDESLELGIRAWNDIHINIDEYTQV